MVWTVAVGPKHRIAIIGNRATTVFAARGDKWIDVLPDDVMSGRDLEDAAGGALADKGIAVGQSFRAADVVAEKGYRRVSPILPDDLVVAWVNLNDPGVAHALAVWPVIE